MNHEVFSNMQKQLTPSPEVRAALSEKLAQAPKKRPVPWIRYGAAVACAALVIGAFPLYQAMQPKERPLHSYVMVEGAGESALEQSVDTGGGAEDYSGDTYTDAVEILPERDQAPSGAISVPNTGALPGGAYIGDVPVQEGAEAYEKLAPYIRPRPDWYGGAYLNDSGWLVVQLVEDKDPGDKSLELQVLDWADSEYVMFSSCKYSLAHLTELMDRLNALPGADPACRDVMASWGVDEEANRIELTLTQVNDHILSILGSLDPDDDAIYVQVGQRATANVGGEDVRTDSANTEAPAVYHAIRDGDTAPVPDSEDLIADEPVYDGAPYDVEELPQELPQEKRPAFVETDSVPEEDVNTSSWFPED